METKTHSQPLRRTLELTVLSAEELNVDQKLTIEDLYVVVRAESINCYTTGMAKESGEGKASWNDKLLVDVPMHAKSITLEMKCNTSTSVKDVGVARIAVSDVVEEDVLDHSFKFFSYRLRDWEGRCNGVLKFSVRVSECSSSGVALSIPARGDN
ncbi:protein SRC2 homolog [Abrus precatorius]|uniref:Protein SRC2 homolog n=1 Tax=Abrus precatorius TaxID=3816 RepID=A0A8B8LAF4_ABRPR|nr:protein SRC2 homolog [Abrus precatorius]